MNRPYQDTKDQEDYDELILRKRGYTEPDDSWLGRFINFSIALLIFGFFIGLGLLCRALMH